MSVSAVYSSTNLVVKPPTGQSLTVAEALVTLSAYKTGSVAIEDTASNISSSWGDLQKLNSRISGITLSTASDALTINAKQFKTSGVILGKLASTTQINVKDALVSDITAFQGNARIAQFTVADNAVNLSANLDKLQASSKVSAISVSGSSNNLVISYAQLSINAGTLGKITNNYTLTVNDVKVDDVMAVAQNTRVGTMNIKDTSQEIGEGIDKLDDLVSRIGKINGTDRGLVSLTSAAYSVSGMVLGKIYTGYQIAIQSATLPETLAASKNARVQSVKVQDTGANFVANLASLNKVGSKITSIELSDSSNTVNLTYSQYTTYAKLINKITTPGVTFAVKGVSLSNLSALQANSAVTSIGISDTATNVSAALDSLRTNTKVNAITLTGSKNTIALTADQLEQDQSVLDEITNKYTLAVSRVKAADAFSIGTTSGVTSVSVTDTGEQIAAHIDDLQGLGSTLKAVIQSDTSVLEITASQYVKDKGALAKLGNSYKVNVAGVAASAATLVGSDARVNEFSVNDTAKNISAYFNSLDALGNKLTQIDQSDGGIQVDLVQSQYLTKSTTIAKINGGDYSLNVTGVTAGYAAQIAQNNKVNSLQVADVGKNVTNYLTGLTSAASRVDLSLSITITNSRVPLIITAEQYDQEAPALQAITSNYALAITDVAADDASMYAAYDHVDSVSVRDSAEMVTGTLASLKALGDKLMGVTLTSDNLLEWTSTQYALNQSTLNKITNAYELNVRDVAAASAAKIASQSNVTRVYVSDTSGNLSTFLDSLALLDGKLAGVTETDGATPIDITANDWLSDGSTLAKFNGGEYTVNVHGATAAQASLMDADDHVVKINIVDTGVNLVAKLDELENLDPGVLGDITISGNPNISLTASQLKDHEGILSKISNLHSFAVSEASVADALEFATRQDVSSLVVSDAGAAVATDIANLTAIGGKLKSLAITTTTPMVLTGAQYAASTTTLKKISNSYSLALSEVTTQNAITWSNTATIVSMDIMDSVANIASRLDTLNNFNIKINQIEASDASDLLTFNASQLSTAAPVLSKIDANVGWRVKNMTVADAISANRPNRIEKLTVADSSSTIGSNLDALQALSTKLESITQLGSTVPMNITATQLVNDAEVLGKISNNYNLKVSQVLAANAADTAAIAHVYTIAVKDDVANVVSNLTALQALGSKLSMIEANDPANHLDLTEAQYSANRVAIGKMASGMLVDVSSVKAANAYNVASDQRVAMVNVSDVGVALSVHLDTLNSLGSKLGEIIQTDGVALTLTVDQYKANDLALSSFVTAPDVQVRNVAANEASSIASSLSNYGDGSSFSVADSAASIKANWDALNALSNNDKLTGISVTDPRNVIALTNAQFAASTDLFPKITGSFSYSVSGMSFENAQALIAADAARVASISVLDDSTTIASNLDALQAMGAKLSSITQAGTASTMSLTRSQMLLDAAALGKITDDYTISLTEATASQALALATDAKVVDVSVVDTAANISKNWAALSELGAKLISLDVSDDDNALNITESQITVNGAVVLLMPDNTVFVNNALAEHASAIAGDYPNARINVVDTALSISQNFDALAALNANAVDGQLNSIRVSDGQVLALTAEQWSQDVKAVEKLAGSYSITVSDVSAADAQDVASAAHVSGLTLKDNSANVFGQLAQLETLAASGKLTDIVLEDDAVMQLTQTQYNQYAHALGLIKFNLNLDVTDVAAADADEVASNTAVVSLSVKDSAQNVTDNLFELHSLSTTLTGVEVTDSQEIQMSYEQYLARTDLAAKITGATLDLSAAPVGSLTALKADGLVGHFAITGSSSDLADRWDDLIAAGDQLTTVTQTGSPATMFITAAQYADSTALRSKFTDTYALSVSGVSAGDAKTLTDADASVATVSVVGTAQQISANLNDLLGLEDKLLAIAQTDTANVALTASQYQTNPQLLSLFSMTPKFAVSDFAAADAVLLGNQSEVAHLTVTDTADNVAPLLNELQGMAEKITAITFTDTSPLLAVDAANWSAASQVVSTIQSNYSLNLTDVYAADATTLAGISLPVKASGVQLAVSDNEQNILNNLADLNSLAVSNKLSEISVSDTHVLNVSQQEALDYSAALARLTSQDAYEITT
jgi:hypothetical protein